MKYEIKFGIFTKKHKKFFYEFLLCPFMPFMVQNPNKQLCCFINLVGIILSKLRKQIAHFIKNTFIYFVWVGLKIVHIAHFFQQFLRFAA
jgi:hypothetical protein